MGSYRCVERIRLKSVPTTIVAIVQWWPWTLRSCTICRPLALTPTINLVDLNGCFLLFLSKVNTEAWPHPKDFPDPSETNCVASSLWSAWILFSVVTVWPLCSRGNLFLICTMVTNPRTLFHFVACSAQTNLPSMFYFKIATIPLFRKFRIEANQGSVFLEQ